ncbi:MAG: hypothetical protein WCJ22_03715 [Actinomycetes bacterium]
MLNPELAGLSNQRLLEMNRARRELFDSDITKFYPWWRRCDVSLLIVTDGNLNFGDGDFGLSTFIRTMLDDAPMRIRFRITLAHLRGDIVDMLSAETRIVRRINDFRFDEPDHFSPTSFDEVWLFGFETSFSRSEYPSRFANPGRYPAGRLGDAELLALAQHMNAPHGGGIFATGDHGQLGRALCGSIQRVRNMRWWDNFPSPADATNEVSMLGPRRNDTNREGRDSGWRFSDQSDDVPQEIELTLYSTPLNLHRAKAHYPHPLLCGRNGRIDVLPDHPHEGECRLPTNLGLSDTPDGGNEFPFTTSTTMRLEPELIAFGRVPAGNTGLGVTGFKQATQAHRFPVISAYDGHRAGVGRIACDSTWHHFVNVNLIGVLEGGGFDEFGPLNPTESGTKHDGFLSSTSGGAALDKIRNYYTNIGVWIAPTARHSCFNSWIWWELVFNDRIMEATLVSPDITFERLPANVLWSIGVHARDVYGRRASQCQTLEWVFDWVRRVWPEIRFWIDPWDPLHRSGPARKGMLGVPTLEVMPMVDIALGAALVSLRQALPYPPDKLTEEHDKIAAEAIAKGLEFGVKAALAEHAAVNRQLAKVFKVVER